MSKRRVTITLSDEDYDALVAAAEAEDRTVVQEVRHRIRRSLRSAPAIKAPRVWPNGIGDVLPTSPRIGDVVPSTSSPWPGGTWISTTPHTTTHGHLRVAASEENVA